MWQKKEPLKARERTDGVVLTVLYIMLPVCRNMALHSELIGSVSGGIGASASFAVLSWWWQFCFRKEERWDCPADDVAKLVLPAEVLIYGTGALMGFAKWINGLMEKGITKM